MYRDVLRFVVERGGAPVTEIQKFFGLPKEMAACLCVELQDAGWLTDHELSPCHHQDPDTSCTQCSGGSCASSSDHGHLEREGSEFKQGCCGMNSPYRVTELGRAYLDGR